MKKLLTYIALILFEAVLCFTYGLVLGSKISFWVCLSVAFIVPFAVLSVLFKNQPFTSIRLIEVLIISLFFAAIFVVIFFDVNLLGGELVAEYDVTVEEINFRGEGHAYFTTPNGRYADVGLNDYRVISDDDYIDVGDTIRVREYKGSFNGSYFVLVD